MKIILLFTMLLGAFPMLSYAQFPSFTNFEANKVYEDNNPHTKPFRDYHHLSNRVDAEFAFCIGEETKNLITLLKNRIEVIKDDSRLEIKDRNDSIAVLQDSIAFLTDVKDYFYSVNKFTGRPSIGAGILPVRRASQARFFFQQNNTEAKIDVLPNLLLQTNIDKSAIAADLVSGSVGPFKVTVRAALIDSDDTSSVEKVSDKLVNGTLLNSNAMWPIFYKAGGLGAIYIPLRAGFSIDNLSMEGESALKSTIYFGSFGGDCYVRIPIKYTANDRNASLFFNGSLEYVTGSNSLYDRLNADHSGFWISKATVGVEINNNMRIALNFPLRASKQQDIFANQRPTIGVQIDPKALF